MLLIGGGRLTTTVGVRAGVEQFHDHLIGMLRRPRCPAAHRPDSGNRPRTAGDGGR